MEMQTCERQRMTLSVAGCAKLWNSTRTRRPEPGEGRHSCLGCPIGARNAGADMEQLERETFAGALDAVCPGCSRPADRLINGRHCVSCYNRRRECSLGINAKGGKPRLLRHIRTETLAIAPVGGQVSVKAYDRVASRTEAMILAAKAAGVPVAFQRAPMAWPAGVSFGEAGR